VIQHKFGDVVQGVELAELNDAGCHAGVSVDAGSYPAVSTTVQEVGSCDSQHDGPSGVPAAQVELDLIHLLYAVRSFERRCQHILAHAGRLKV
jgi:hypothetical protein